MNRSTKHETCNGSCPSACKQEQWLYLKAYIALQKKDIVSKIKQDFKKNTKTLLSLPLYPVLAHLITKQHSFLSCIAICGL